MGKVRFAVITDIHLGPDTRAKLGTKAKGLLKVFARAAAKYKPDFLVDMGDRVTANDAAEARANMTTVTKIFNRIAAPVYNLIGNHDIARLTREENEQIMSNPGTSYSRDIKGYHFVFWN